MSATDGPRQVHIVGTGRSGSTLLAFLLNALDGVASVGEVTGPPAGHPDPVGFSCSCGQALGSDSFWTDIAADMDRRGHAFGPDRWDMRFSTGTPSGVAQVLERSLRVNALDDLRDGLVSALPCGARLRDIADRNVALAESLAAACQATVVVDASKDVRRPVLLARLRPEVDLRVIHLVRGPHGYATSRRRRRDIPLAVSVREWRRNAGHGRRLAARLSPETFTLIRYEDVCADPLGTLQYLARWMGVRPPSVLPDPDAAEHHIIGNSLRLTGVGSVRLDEGWREELTVGEQRTINRATRREQRLLGYT